MTRGYRPSGEAEQPGSKVTRTCGHDVLVFRYREWRCGDCAAAEVESKAGRVLIEGLEVFQNLILHELPVFRHSTRQLPKFVRLVGDRGNSIGIPRYGEKIDVRTERQAISFAEWWMQCNPLRKTEMRAVCSWVVSFS